MQKHFCRLLVHLLTPTRPPDFIYGFLFHNREKRAAGAPLVQPGTSNQKTENRYQKMLPSADSEDKRWRYQVARAWCWANARRELFKGATNWIQTISWNTTEGQEKSLRERQITCYSFELGEEIRATRNTVSVSSWQQQQGLEINWGLVGVWGTSVGSSQLSSPGESGGQ